MREIGSTDMQDSFIFPTSVSSCFFFIGFSAMRFSSYLLYSICVGFLCIYRQLEVNKLLTAQNNLQGRPKRAEVVSRDKKMLDK